MTSDSRSAVLTVPNALSLLRLATIPVFAVLVVEGHLTAAAVVFAALAATDWLDGYLARRLGQVSRLGELLDPMTDRFAILTALVVLVVAEVVPWWFAVAVVARDVLLTAMIPVFRRRGSATVPVHRLGKAATACLLVAFPLLLLGADRPADGSLTSAVGWTFAVVGVVAYWAVGLLYVRRALEPLDGDERVVV